jgi:hypothetical protein
MGARLAPGNPIFALTNLIVCCINPMLPCGIIIGSA